MLRYENLLLLLIVIAISKAKDLTTIKCLEGKDCPPLEGRNVIDAPVQCPKGQLPDAYGRCQLVWGRNVIDAPVQCPKGQLPDFYGRCKVVWKRNNREGIGTD